MVDIAAGKHGRDAVAWTGRVGTDQLFNLRPQHGVILDFKRPSP
jgi:hypothetical protein